MWNSSNHVTKNDFLICISACHVHVFFSGYLMLGLVVLLVVMESFWQLQQVQALVCLFVGSAAAASLKEDDLDELGLSEWPDNYEISEVDIKFRPPISIISQRMSDSSNPFVEDAFVPFTSQETNYRKTECPPHQPDPDLDPADQNS